MRRIEITKERLEEACAKSRTNEEVGQHLKVSKSTVTRMCRRLGVKIPQARQQTQRGGRRGKDSYLTTQERIERYMEEVASSSNNITRNGRRIKLTEREKGLLPLYRASREPPIKKIDPQEYERLKAEEESSLYAPLPQKI